MPVTRRRPYRIRPLIFSLPSSAYSAGQKAHPWRKNQAGLSPLTFSASYGTYFQEREREGLLEKVASLESATQDNVKLAQKMARLEGQVTIYMHSFPYLTTVCKSLKHPQSRGVRRAAGGVLRPAETAPYHRPLVR